VAVFAERLVSALNMRLDSPLRVEIDEVVMGSGPGQVNVTALAQQIRAQLDDLASLPSDQLTRSNSSAEGMLRLLWHARAREPGEEAAPVIV
jgi:hypothetical protein